MTTLVKVTAVCADDIEIVVQEGPPESDQHDRRTVMYNGAEAVFSAHSGNEVFIYERVKNSG